MKGESAGMRNDIHYLIEIKSISKKTYSIFSTGDRKKAKERYYEICRILEFEMDFESLQISKKLKNVSEVDAKKASMKKVFEEDDFFEAEDIPTPRRLKSSKFHYKKL